MKQKKPGPAAKPRKDTPAASMGHKTTHTSGNSPWKILKIHLYRRVIFYPINGGENFNLLFMYTQKWHNVTLLPDYISQCYLVTH
jgi:hypothetical protein